jgi:hypothetical protein
VFLIHLLVPLHTAYLLYAIRQSFCTASITLQTGRRVTVSSFVGEATANPAETLTARPCLHRSITVVHKGRSVTRENGSYSHEQYFIYTT